MHEVDRLKRRRKEDTVEIEFKKGSHSGEKLGCLKIEFSRERVDENEHGEYDAKSCGGAELIWRVRSSLFRGTP